MSKDYLFVSYSSKDKTFVDRLVKELKNQGVQLWIDDALRSHVGEAWFDIVKDKVCSKYCKGILFFISPNSVVSHQVLKELEYAKSKEVMASHRGKALRILPIESENGINQIDEWLYDLRDELEDQRGINKNWRQQQEAIDLFREICFPDNNTLRISYSSNIDDMVAHLLETLNQEVSSVLETKEEEKLNKSTTSFVYERSAKFIIANNLSKEYSHSIVLELISETQEKLPTHVELVLNHGRCIVGRKSKNTVEQADYCFDSKLSFISRYHFCLETDEEGLCIVDLGSSNGTFLNQMLLKPKVRYPITTGDVITISKKEAVSYKLIQ